MLKDKYKPFVNITLDMKHIIDNIDSEYYNLSYGEGIIGLPKEDALEKEKTLEITLDKNKVYKCERLTQISFTTQERYLELYYTGEFVFNTLEEGKLIKVVNYYHD